MFIARMPIRATPRITSTEATRSAPPTGPAGGPKPTSRPVSTLGMAKPSTVTAANPPDFAAIDRSSIDIIVSFRRLTEPIAKRSSLQQVRPIGESFIGNKQKMFQALLSCGL